MPFFFFKKETSSSENVRLLSNSASEIKLWRNSFLSCAVFSIIASQLFLVCGIAQGFSAVLLPQLQRSLNINSDEASWIASLGTICRPLGAFIEGFIVDSWGRKAAMFMVAFLFACSWMLTAISQNLFVLYLSRILISFAMGMVICVGLYIAEISAPQHRGTLLSLITPLTMFGTLCVYLLGSLLTWRHLSLSISIYSMILIVIIGFLPESYIWYMTKGEKEKAVHSLLRFRNNDLSQVTLEINEAEHRLAQRTVKTPNYFQEFSDAAVWKPFLIMTGFSILQQQAGYTILIYYAVDFFSSLGTDFNGNVLSIIFAIVSTIGSIFLACIVHLYDRKTLLTVSGIGMSLTMAIAALSISNDTLKGYYQLIPIISIFLYMFFCMLGMIDIPWMLIGELFPSRVRGTMSANLTVIIFIITFGVVKIYTILMHNLGQSGTLWYFSVFSLLAVIFANAFVPETRGISLFEIEEYFRNERY